MPGPYDYTTPLLQASQMPQPQEGASLLSGIQQGLQMQYGLHQMQMQLAQQQQAFQAQQAAISDPTPDNITRLMVAMPQVADKLKSAHDAKNEDQQRQDVQDGAAVYGFLQGGNTDGAAQIIQRRVDAGQSQLAPLLAQIQSGDPAQVKQAQATAGTMLAGWMGKDKFAEAYNATAGSPEGQLKSAQAAQAQSEAAKNRVVMVKNADGSETPMVISGNADGAGAQPPGNGGASQGPRAQGPTTVPGPAGAQVAAAAQAAGATPSQIGYLGATAQLESRGKPNAQNGSSTGVFQMQPKTFANLGGTDITDVGQQTAATLKLAAQNARQMQGMLGRAPTNAEVYLAHQQGATGASALISADPNTSAIQALVDAGVSKGKATASIIGNAPPGTTRAQAANMTAGQFVQGWRGAYANANASGDAPTSAPSAPQTAAADGISVAPAPGYTPKPNALLSTGATRDQLAWQYLKTGKLPGDGTRPEGIAINSSVQQRANELWAQSGKSPGELVAAQARWSSAASNLATLQGQQGQMEVQEGTVQNGLSIAADLLKNGAGGATGAKLANITLGAFRRNFGDDPRTNQLEMAMTTAADEYSKILIGNGASTDSARKSAESMFNPDLPIGKLQGNLAFVQQEIAGRRTSGEEQLRHYNAIGLSPTAEAPPSARIAALRAAAKAGGPKAAAAAQKFDTDFGHGMAQNYLGEI